jgi:hypothetical protein
MTGAPGEGIVPGRSCGTCMLCCKVFRIEEAGTEAGEWCQHCVPGKGCKIYETRPEPCRVFFCQWMFQPGLGPEWKPEKSKIVLSVELNGARLAGHVDTNTPGAWRRSPYYEVLKRWSAEGLKQQRQISVWIGQRCIVILPDREIDLGVVGPGEMVMSTAKQTANGTEYGAVKLSRAEGEARRRGA